MAIKPSTLVISVTEEDPLHTVKLMLGIDEVPEAIVLDSEILAYPLHLDTKYYSADIHLCTMKSKTIGCQEFAEGVGAAVIKFDSNKISSMQEVEGWLPFLKELSPEVQILLCDRCADESPIPGHSRMDVQRWCVENRFELVELNPESESDDEEEMALPGLAPTTGIKRVMQALQSHLWPNMQMKDNRNHVNPALAAYINGSTSEDDPVVNLVDNLQELNVENEVRSSGMINRIDQLLGAEDGMDSDNLQVEPEIEFANLLSRLSEVKEQAASMPSDQRKMCAEQVVKAFWNAIGGDEDEIFDEILEEFHGMDAESNN